MKQLLITRLRASSVAQVWLAAFAAALAAFAAPALAATEISQNPIASSRSAQVKPNIMLLMDTSDSMGFSHMPDETEDLVTPVAVGYKSAQCNPLYYNPTKPYNLLPRTYDGAEFPTSFTTFTAAAYDPFVSGNTDTRNLSTSFRAYETGTVNGTDYSNAAHTVKQPYWAPDTPQMGYYWVYTGPLAATMDYTSTVCQDAETQPGTAQYSQTASGPAGGVWTRYTVPSADQQKFANWYSYYRTRMLLTKTAVSRSFNALNDSRRVGFITVEPTRKDAPNDTALQNYVNPSKFLPVNDFLAAAGGQRQKFYDKVFAQKARGLSPAREGLSRVGRYYGNNFDGINGSSGSSDGMGGVDPMQFSCQQNFTIMTTDGYWNTATETPDANIAPFRGGPVGLDGKNLVGETDGTETDGTGNTPPGVWDGYVDQDRIFVDRKRTYSDGNCQAAVTYQSKTRTLGITQNFTTSRLATTRTRHQMKSDTYHYTKKIDNYQTSTVQYQYHTEQYNTQPLIYALIDVQSTRKKVYFTHYIFDYYYTLTYQLQESSWQIQETDTAWDKQVSEQYTQSVTQWQAKQIRQTVQTTNYRFKKTQRQKRVYQNISHGSGYEYGILTADCTEGNGVTCTKRYIPNNNAAWVPVTTNGCTPGTSTDGNYYVTECQTATIVPDGAVSTCSPGGDSLSADSNFYLSTCTITTSTVQSTPSCAPDGISQQTGSPYTVTDCETITVKALDYVDTSGGPCQDTVSTDGTFTRTICSVGSAAHGERGSDVCTPGPSQGPNYANIFCTHYGPTTTYVPPGTCSGQTGTNMNGFIPTVACTPGIASAPRYVANCTQQTTGTPYTSSAVNVTCSGQLNKANNFVAACTNGMGSTTDPGPPYTHRSCSFVQPGGAFAWSPVCTNGTRTDLANFAYSICTKSPMYDTYVAAATSCAAHTADAFDGSNITCTALPSVGPTDEPCGGGTGQDNAGDPATQYTNVCGSRVKSNMTVATCNSGTTDQGNGDFQTCQVTPGAMTPTQFCNVGDNAGVRCSLTPTTDIVVPACNLGTVPGTANDWITTSCTTVNATPLVDSNTCNAGTTFNLSTKTYTTCVVTPVQPTQAFDGTCNEGTSRVGANVEICVKISDQTGTTEPLSCADSDSHVSPYPHKHCYDIYAGNSVDYPTTSQCQENDGSQSPYFYSHCDTQSSTISTAPCTPTGPYATGNFTDECHASSQSAERVLTCVPGPAYYDSTLGTSVVSCRTESVQTSTQTQCNVGTTGPDANSVTTVCVAGSLPGTARSYIDTQTTTEGRYSGTVLVSAQPQIGPNQIGTGSDDNLACHTAANPLPPLPAPLALFQTPPQSGCTHYSCSATALSGGSTNSLADVSQYYYVTDIRPTGPNNFRDDGDFGVPHRGSGPLDDRLSTQHMTTFVIALGVSGTLNYPADFPSILNGTKAWPEWPDHTLATPVNQYATSPGLWDDPRGIDDYWHTAVNGRGQYFSARDPGAVADGVSAALAGIDSKDSAGAAAGVTSLEPTLGDNTAFITSYKTFEWTGDVVANAIDLASGSFVTDTTVSNWSAATKLADNLGAQCDNRQIYLMRSGASPSLTDFTYQSYRCNASVPKGQGVLRADGLNSTDLQAFSTPNAIFHLSQYVQMTDGTAGTEPQRTNSAGAALVNFIRGQSFNEGFVSGDPNKFFRARTGPLGDIIDAQAVYVKAPFASYQDLDYAEFKTNNANRAGMVYVAANDGMLHAFYATTALNGNGGQEAWAVIPSAVLPNLYKLADNNYRNQHQFYVDGTPTVGDIRNYSVSGAAGWSTLLVGGLNAGGKGYYALDVTDPANPRARWEFKFSDTCYDQATPATSYADCNLGLTFGKPVITKLADGPGTWVVMFTSGYNNTDAVSHPGDGGGYLYVLDALTGKILYKIPTLAGTALAPSNLGQINNYVDDTQSNNTTLRVYGGDMLGNIWRFDVNDTQVPSGREALLLAKAVDPSSNAQPITTRPELAELNGLPMVFIGTGRLVGAPDVADTQIQSVYGIVDPLTQSTAVPVVQNLRTTLKKVTMTQVGVAPTAYRTAACNSGDNCSSTSGFFVDLPDLGERVNVDMKLVLGTLVIGSNVPDASACSIGGHSWFSYLNFQTGLAVQGSPNSQVSEFLSSALIVGFNVIKLPSGGFVSGNRMSNGTTQYRTPSVLLPGPTGKRVSWREILAQ